MRDLLDRIRALPREQLPAVLAVVFERALEPVAVKPDPEPSETRWIRATEAAALAQVSRRKIWEWARRRDWSLFSCKPSPKTLLISEAGFLRWLAMRRAGPAGD